MDEEKINSRFEEIEKRLDILENKREKLEKEDNVKSERAYNFKNKKLDHNKLLEELLKSSFCHSKNGLTGEEIIETFKKNERPVVPKKIKDLLSKWVQRKKIDIIKEMGKSRYFWIEKEKIK